MHKAAAVNLAVTDSIPLLVFSLLLMSVSTAKSLEFASQLPRLSITLNVTLGIIRFLTPHQIMSRLAFQDSSASVSSGAPRQGEFPFLV